MKLSSSILPSLLTLHVFHSVGNINAFTPGLTKRLIAVGNNAKVETSLKISVGLGPDADEKEVEASSNEVINENKEPEIEPDHELFRDSRLTDIDKQCDSWFGSLLGENNEPSFLGEVSEEALRRLHTLHKLERNVSIQNSE